MTPSLLELAKDVTLALVESGNLSSDDMYDTLHKTHATLVALQAQEASGTATNRPVAQMAPVNWHKSITKPTVACLECGAPFKQLSLRHLRLHDLDGRSYRIKYGIPGDTTARRREVVQETRPWGKTLTFRSAQGRHGHAAAEPESEALCEATEEPVVAASTRPRRQRQTTPQKQTARKKSRQT